MFGSDIKACDISGFGISKFNEVYIAWPTGIIEMILPDDIQQT